MIADECVIIRTNGFILATEQDDEEFDELLAQTRIRVLAAYIEQFVSELRQASKQVTIPNTKYHCIYISL